MYPSASHQKSRYAVLGVLALIVAPIAFAGGLSVPVSNQILQGEVLLSGGETIQFKVFDGTMLKVRDVERGSYWGISPTIQRDGSVGLVVFDIIQPGAGLEAMTQVGRFSGALGERLRFEGAESFDIVIHEAAKSGLSEKDFLEMQRQALREGGGLSGM